MSLYPRINGRKTDILAYISSKILLAHLSLFSWRRQNGRCVIAGTTGKIPDQVGNDGENGNDMRRSGMTKDKLEFDNL